MAFDSLTSNRTVRFRKLFECVSYLQYSTNQYPTIISSLPSAAQVTRTLEPENSWQEKKKYQLPENNWFVKKRKIPDPVPQTTVENIGSVTQGLLNKELKPPDLRCQGHANARGSRWPTRASEVSVKLCRSERGSCWCCGTFAARLLKGRHFSAHWHFLTLTLQFMFWLLCQQEM